MNTPVYALYLRCAHERVGSGALTTRELKSWTHYTSLLTVRFTTVWLNSITPFKASKAEFNARQHLRAYSLHSQSDKLHMFKETGRGLSPESAAGLIG